MSVQLCNLETYTFVADLDFHEADAASFRPFFTPETIIAAFQQVLRPMFQLDDYPFVVMQNRKPDSGKH